MQLRRCRRTIRRLLWNQTDSTVTVVCSNRLRAEALQSGTISLVGTKLCLASLAIHFSWLFYHFVFLYCLWIPPSERRSLKRRTSVCESSEPRPWTAFMFWLVSPRPLTVPALATESVNAVAGFIKTPHITVESVSGSYFSPQQ